MTAQVVQYKADIKGQIDDLLKVAENHEKRICKNEQSVGNYREQGARIEERLDALQDLMSQTREDVRVIRDKA